MRAAIPSAAGIVTTTPAIKRAVLLMALASKLERNRTE